MMGEISAYVMMGLTGSGKSTWAEMKAKVDKLNGITTLIANGDSVRKMLYGKYEFVETLEPVVMNTILEITEVVVQSGNNIIIDEMLLSLTSQKRKSLNNVLRAIGVDKIYIVKCESSIEGLQRRITFDPRGYTAEKWHQVYNENLALYESTIADNEGHDFIIEV